MKKIDFIRKYDPDFPSGGAFFKIQFSSFAAFPVYGACDDFECTVIKLVEDVKVRAEEMIRDFALIDRRDDVSAKD